MLSKTEVWLHKWFFYTAIAALSLLLSGCILSRSHLKIGWPILGRPCKPMDIDTSLLRTSETAGIDVELDPYYSQQFHPLRFYQDNEIVTWPPNRDNLREDVILHIYSDLSVEEHFFPSGTYVYYLYEDEIFYLWGYDFANHTDGMVGPFLGDPREELPQSSSGETPLLNTAWWCVRYLLSD